MLSDLSEMGEDQLPLAEQTGFEFPRLLRPQHGNEPMKRPLFRLRSATIRRAHIDPEKRAMIACRDDVLERPYAR